MNHEYSPVPDYRKPFEEFGLTEQEQLFWRVTQKRFENILKEDRTVIHKIEPSSNDFGEFLFVTTSRPTDHGRCYITFYGLGYHELREKWIANEWFWYQANPNSDLLKSDIPKSKAEEIIKHRQEEIAPSLTQNTQTRRGNLFELLADLTDEDGAKAEIEDLESLDIWLREVDEQMPLLEPTPTGENLLDEESRAKLPPIKSGEALGLNALAQVKFFTPDSNWSWYASEFDGEDLFFGLVSGQELELGYFSLAELKEADETLGLEIERDTHFQPKKLGELMELYRKLRSG